MCDTWVADIVCLCMCVLGVVRHTYGLASMGCLAFRWQSLCVLVDKGLGFSRQGSPCCLLVGAPLLVGALMTCISPPPPTATPPSPPLLPGHHGAGYTVAGGCAHSPPCFFPIPSPLPPPPLPPSSPPLLSLTLHPSIHPPSIPPPPKKTGRTRAAVGVAGRSQCRPGWRDPSAPD